MKAAWLDEKRIRIIVITFSVLGLAVLALISSLSGTQRVGISDLGSHIGETVEVQGTVVGTSAQKGGFAQLLVHDEGALLEVSVERSSRRLDPGYLVIIKGEPFEKGDGIYISVSTERSVRVLKGQEPLEYTGITQGEICRVNGTVISMNRQGYSSLNLTIERFGSEGIRERIWVLVMNTEGEFGIGDGIEAIGLHDRSGGMISYGSGSVRTTFKAVPVATSLNELMGFEPGHVSRDPLVIEGYLRYTPTGRTMYIGESSEGARVSIKAIMQERVSNVSRGDLIRLINCSLEWDPSGMRYNLLPSSLQLIKAHGPWMLRLSSLPYGIGEYEGCTVIVEAQLIRTVDMDLLIDENSTIEVRGASEGNIEHRGIVKFDVDKNAYYIEAGSEI